MPRRTTASKPDTAKHLKNHSFETLVAAWFTQARWQVFIPLFDHGHCTDLLISDGPKYYRIQVKTIEAQKENVKVENKWSHSNVQFVALFAKNSNWGYIFPAFAEKRKRLNAEGHERFQQNRHDFLKAFHSL
jgi:hypothetical protein